MLYDVIKKTYYEIYKKKELPTFLRFRLSNFGAFELNYQSFKEYFSLNNRYEVFAFVLDDNNIEEILRYASNYLDETFKYVYPPKYQKSYSDDSEMEHREINKSLEKEEKGYQK